MNEDNKIPATQSDAPQTTPADTATADVIPERKIRHTPAFRTKKAKAAEDTLYIPPQEEPAASENKPKRRFIKTEGAEFVSVRAEKVKTDNSHTDIEKYSDRLVSSPVPEEVHTGHTGKIDTYDTIHAPMAAFPGRMISTEPVDDTEYEEQLTLEGADLPAPSEEEITKEVSPEGLAAKGSLRTNEPTRHFDVKTNRLRQIAGSADEGVQRNPDQMMMEGFDNIGKKTEEEIRAEEALKDELQHSREKRIKSFRFWDKAPGDDPDKEPDEKFSHAIDITALPAFAAKFSERFSHIPMPFTPVKGEEYTDGGERRPIFTAIKKGRGTAFISMILLAVSAAVLLIIDLAAKITAANTGGFFTVFGGSVTVLAAVNLAFLLVSVIVMLPDLKNGAVSVLKLRPKTDALLLFMMGSALLQTVTAFFTQLKVASDFQLMAPAAILVCVPYMLAKVFYYDNARHCFKTISAKSEKSYLRKVTDPALKARLGCMDETNTVYSGKTRFISRFPKSVESDARDEMPRTRITALLGGISLIAGLIAMIIKKSPVCGLSALTLCLALSMPVCCLVAAGFFLSRTNQKLALKSSFVQSFNDAKTFSVIDTMVCDAADLFDARITNCLTAKRVSEKQVRFAAAAIAADAGSMMKKLFAEEISNYSDRLPPAKNTVYEDKMGVSSYVGGCTVLLGNRDMMLNHGVEIPDENVVNQFVSTGARPLYLAMEGRFTALFSVSYAVSSEVRDGIGALIDNGTALLLGTTDPNISEEFAEFLLQLSENSVRMIGSTAAKQLAEAQATVADAEDAGVVFTDSFASLSRVAAEAVRLDALKTVIKAVSLAGSFVSLILGFVLCMTGAFVSVSALSVLAIQAVWAGLCFLSPLFAMSVSKLLRRFTKKKAGKSTENGFDEIDDSPADEERAEPAEETQPSAAEPQPEEAPAETPEAETSADEPSPQEAPAEDLQPADTEPEAEDTLEERIDAIPTPPQTPRQTKSKRRFSLDFLDFQKPASHAEKTDAPRKPMPKQEEKSVDDALTMFAPKEEPKARKEEEAAPRFIASEGLRSSLSSIDTFISDISETNAPETDKSAPGKDFSLFGKDQSGARYSARNAGDIEKEYERRKAEEKTVRSLFTAPEIDDAPIYDLRKKQPAPPLESKFTAPLDTSDVNVYNNELFRRFENDDDVFAGLHENEKSPRF